MQHLHLLYPVCVLRYSPQKLRIDPSATDDPYRSFQRFVRNRSFYLRVLVPFGTRRKTLFHWEILPIPSSDLFN